MFRLNKYKIIEFTTTLFLAIAICISDCFVMYNIYKYPWVILDIPINTGNYFRYYINTQVNYDTIVIYKTIL
jgi:hypothetical protein